MISIVKKSIVEKSKSAARAGCLLYRGLDWIWHRGHEERYAPGATFDLDHLQPYQVYRLIQKRAVMMARGERPKMVFEDAGASPDDALALCMAGLGTLEEMVATSPGRIAGWIGVDSAQVEAWQQAAQELLAQQVAADVAQELGELAEQAEEPKEDIDGENDTGSTAN